MLSRAVCSRRVSRVGIPGRSDEAQLRARAPRQPGAELEGGPVGIGPAEDDDGRMIGVEPQGLVASVQDESDVAQRLLEHRREGIEVVAEQLLPVDQEKIDLVVRGNPG